MKNFTFDAWNAASRPAPDLRPSEGEVVLNMNETPLTRYSVMPPLQGMTGDILAEAMYAGTGVENIDDCPSAAKVVRSLFTGAS